MSYIRSMNRNLFYGRRKKASLFFSGEAWRRVRCIVAPTQMVDGTENPTFLRSLQNAPTDTTNLRCNMSKITLLKRTKQGFLVAVTDVLLQGLSKNEK